MVSLVRCGTLFYRFLIFAFFLTFFVSFQLNYNDEIKKMADRSIIFKTGTFALAFDYDNEVK